MDTTQLGRTGRTVSVAGLGCGGSSRIGLSQGLSRAECVALVKLALDEGVTVFDTAEAYGTEDIVGAALEKVDPDAVTVSTKSRYRDPQGLFGVDRILDNLHASLRRLKRERVDIFHVHAVRPGDYAYVMDEIAPALVTQKAAGKIGHVGITETPPNDPRQVMMTRAVHDDVWEVVMVAYHLMHHLPARLVFPATQSKGIGTLIMFAVRSIFSRPDRLRTAMYELAAKGAVQEAFSERDAPLAALVEEAGAASLTELAYRFARHGRGTDVVLFGTSNPLHVKQNIAAINGPPLPEATLTTITNLFGHLTGVGLDLPDHMNAKQRGERSGNIPRR
ncbi:MAG: aldo/keto reductase [Pseudomonadota bacterium]